MIQYFDNKRTKKYIIMLLTQNAYLYQIWFIGSGEHLMMSVTQKKYSVYFSVIYIGISRSIQINLE